MNTKPAARYEAACRRLAKIVRDVLSRETFDTMADLTDAVKFRCAVLRIPWSNDAINDAYRLVESNRPLVRPSPQLRRRLEELPAPMLSHDEACAILARLGWQKPKDHRRDS